MYDKIKDSFSNHHECATALSVGQQCLQKKLEFFVDFIQLK